MGSIDGNVVFYKFFNRSPGRRIKRNLVQRAIQEGVVRNDKINPIFDRLTGDMFKDVQGNHDLIDWFI